MHLAGAMENQQPAESQPRSKPVRYRRVPNHVEQHRTHSDGEHADAGDSNRYRQDNNFTNNNNAQSSNHRYYPRGGPYRRTGGDHRHFDGMQDENARPRRPLATDRRGIGHTENSHAEEGVSTHAYGSQMPGDNHQHQHFGKSKVQPRSVVDGVDETLADASAATVNAGDRPDSAVTREKAEKQPARDSDTTCDVCLLSRREPIYGILDDACKHFFCYVCAVRLRTVCRDNRCPICRDETQHIRLSRMLASTSTLMRPRKGGNDAGDDGPTFEKTTYKKDDEAGLIYASEHIYKLVNDQLFRHKCPKCPYTTAAFSYLEQHAKEAHDLFYCHVCLKHLQLFTYERRAYGKEALADHMRTGDGTGTAITHGHPRCQLCNARTFDRDEQLRHNRREHHVCYCCEWGPKRKIVVFEDLLSMRKHMKKDHFVCEMDMCAEIDPPRAFNERQDLELHQVESHNRRDLSAELFFNLSFRRTEPASANDAAGPSGRNSASANDRASTTVAPAVDAPAIGARTPLSGGPATNLLANTPTWMSGRDSSLSTGVPRSSGVRNTFAAQPEEFPTIAGMNSRDPLESMLFARRLNDESSRETQYPRLQLGNAGALNEMLNKKPQKPKAAPSAEHRAGGGSSSRAVKPQAQPQKRREDDFPALAGSARLPPGLPQPEAAGGSSKSKPATTTNSTNSTFAARVQQSSSSSAAVAGNDTGKATTAKTGGKQPVASKSGDAATTGETSRLFNIAPNERTKKAAEPISEFPTLGAANPTSSLRSEQNRAAEQPVASKSGDAASTGETSRMFNIAPSERTKKAAEPIIEFPTLGATNPTSSLRSGQNRAAEQPRWAAAAKAGNGEAKKSNEKSNTADAVEQTAALSKKLASSSRTSTAASAMDAADRYNQLLAAGALADDDDAIDAFPSMSENNERERSDMGPWWRKADDKSGSSKKKPAKTVWKKK